MDTIVHSVWMQWFTDDCYSKVLDAILLYIRDEFHISFFMANRYSGFRFASKVEQPLEIWCWFYNILLHMGFSLNIYYRDALVIPPFARFPATLEEADQFYSATVLRYMISREEQGLLREKHGGVPAWLITNDLLRKIYKVPERQRISVSSIPSLYFHVDDEYLRSQILHRADHQQHTSSTGWHTLISSNSPVGQRTMELLCNWLRLGETNFPDYIKKHWLTGSIPYVVRSFPKP